MFRFIAATSLAVTGLALTAPAAQAQDAEAGEKVFKKCASCHMVGAEARNRVGPVLTGVLGRPAGSYEGFKYGKSMVAAGEAGLVWDEAGLFDYLADPKAFLRTYLDDDKAKAKMAFKLQDEDDRRNVVAYLATFSPAGDAAEQAALTPAVPVEPGATALCVRNLNSHEHFFAVEVEGAERRTAHLAPGEALCTEAEPGQTGMVSVFETAEGFEGCSRLVPVGTTEEMLKYVDFDRCFWSSNT